MKDLIIKDLFMKDLVVKKVFRHLMMGAMVVGMVACGSKDEPDNNSGNGGGNNGGGGSNPNATEVHSTPGSYYVGITGFNSDVYIKGGANYRYDILNKGSLSEFTNFVNRNLSNTGEEAKGTLLYYAVDDNLSYLNQCSFPTDVENVAIITFTDGLDLGSNGKVHGAYASEDEHIAAINNKIKTVKVNGVTMAAYSIGVRGNDIKTESDLEQFDTNLTQLASTPANKYYVQNMSEVNETFKKIADDLFKQSVKPQFRVRIPEPYPNTQERFTFDNVTNATDSKLYVEGTFVDGKLTNVKYVGCSSESGTTIIGTSVENNQLEFVFENFVDTQTSSEISIQYLMHWYIRSGKTEWTSNEDEFNKDAAAKVENIYKSAVIMLALDCSSSLGNNFAQVQQAAVNFLNILAGSTSNNGGSGGKNDKDDQDDKDDKDDKDNQDNSEYCWEVIGKMAGVSVTQYVWGQESVVKAFVQTWQGQGYSVSYSKTSFSDEYTCKEQNKPDEPVEAAYYIKHPWATGRDADWSWQPMTYWEDEEVYIYVGAWGGKGCNINTRPDDAGAQWFPADDDEDYALGQIVIFVYDAEYDELYIAETLDDL